MKKLFLLISFAIFLTGCSSTIQREVNITKNISSYEKVCDLYDCQNYSLLEGIEKRINISSLSRECLNYSISQKDLDNALEKGAKIITSQQWKQVVKYMSYDSDLNLRNKSQNGTCIGITYIIEGKKSLLNKYAPMK